MHSGSHTPRRQPLQSRPPMHTTPLRSGDTVAAAASASSTAASRTPLGSIRSPNTRGANLGGSSGSKGGGKAVGGSAPSTIASAPHNRQSAAASVAGRNTSHDTAGAAGMGGKLSTQVESVIRGVYTEKLTGSVEAIIQTLAVDLPQDHIFQQLIADPETRQYAKVRMTEVIETFLYSTQAQQYHDLALDLAARDGECQQLRQDLGRAQREADELRAQLEQMEQQQQRLQEEREKAEAGAGTADASRASDAANPMSEEEARRELMGILEEATREAELERAREALGAPTRAADVLQSEAQYADANAYLVDAMAALYSTAQGLLGYVDCSLESLDALRTELEEADHQGGSSGGGLPPRRPATSAERQSVAEVRERMREGQLRTTRALDRLAHSCADAEKERERLAAALAEARKELQLKRAAAEGARDLQAALDRLRQDYAAATAAGRDDAHRQLDELQARAAAAEAELREQRARAAKAEGLHRDALGAVAEADERLRALEAEMARQGTQLRTAADIAARTAEAKLRNAADELSDRESELLCARVELHLTRLEALYTESEAAKRGLLCEHGHRGRITALEGALRQAREAARDEAMRQQLAEAAAQQREVSQRAAAEELAGLLRAMWEDERVDAALAAEGQTYAEAADPTDVSREEIQVEAEEADEGGGGAEHFRTPLAKSSSVGSGGGGNGSSPLPRPSRRRGSLPHSSHRVPPSLDGLSSALTYAYSAVRQRQEQRQDELCSLRARLQARTNEVAALQAVEAQLRALLAALQARERQWKDSLDKLTENNPAKDLLGRQEALLRAASDERNALRDQLKKLNDDFMKLETTNGKLHERCAAKEQELARLKGLLKQ